MDAARESHLLAQPELTPLEQEVLEEYERLAENMKRVGCIPFIFSVLGKHWLLDLAANSPQLATVLDEMSVAPSTEILDGLRELERKTSLVFTLLKASVYSIVLQQEIDWGGQPGEGSDA